MTWSEVTVLVTAALLLLLWRVWVTASRLDRLHRKVATSRAALENQLVRRASAAAELAAGGLLDPVSSVLLGEAAWAALSAGGHGRTQLVEALPDLAGLLSESERVRDGADQLAAHGHVPYEAPPPPVDRDLVESELSRTARTALADPDEVAALREVPLGKDLVEALGAAWYRVQLSRQFHNEAVVQSRRMRRKALVRLLRLQGHAPSPRTVEIDDAWPEALGRPGHHT
ncbi:hypothetical protein [Actinotalea sp. K2]|uniref:hypothetical protein n=1 Tax=Actinotalea sp. K2 TaxID=2939438 RepID=UPI002017352F|nr:hypothetical protein [Actinotalea sp. K2]MCL3862308.1 hypothetical protein [Actinotalea sp. K2]